MVFLIVKAYKTIIKIYFKDQNVGKSRNRKIDVKGALVIFNAKQSVFMLVVYLLCIAPSLFLHLRITSDLRDMSVKEK
jgi:hypothetical protein